MLIFKDVQLKQYADLHEQNNYLADLSTIFDRLRFFLPEKIHYSEYNTLQSLFRQNQVLKFLLHNLLEL
jgi:hypothetical protein